MADTTVRIDGNTLRLPGGVAVRFIRALRLPETGTHPLPPGLGEFPVRRIADYADRVPEEWRARGGVMLPVYLREAMWLSFAGTSEPAALQVGVGKVCAVSGQRQRIPRAVGRAACSTRQAHQARGEPFGNARAPRPATWDRNGHAPHTC